MSRFEGTLVNEDFHFAIVAARFNGLISARLVAGAHDALRRHGVPEEAVDEAWVPGAFELPLACRTLAASGRYDAIIALGAVIRGSTPHFDHVAGQAAGGVARASLETGVPIIFGVLTTDSIEQAIERAGTKAGNKGADSAVAALEMASLMKGMTTGDERKEELVTPSDFVPGR